jgi:hypothetical protein
MASETELRTQATPYPAVSPAVRRVMAADPKVEVLLLDPNQPDDDYHGFRVRGRAVVDQNSGQQLIREILAALEAGADSNMCFDPYYGVRFVAGGEVVDMLFCFPCGNVLIVEPDGSHGYSDVASRPKRVLRSLL